MARLDALRSPRVVTKPRFPSLPIPAVAAELERLEAAVLDAQHGAALPTWVAAELRGLLESPRALFAAARDELASLDRSANGLLDVDEAQAARALESPAGRLVAAVVEGLLETYEEALDAWLRAVNDAVDSLERRASLYRQLDGMAEHHASSAIAVEALRWHFRALATASRDRLTVDEVRRALVGAERSFFAFLPALLRPRSADPTARGHLSDDEVRYLLGVQDLERHATERRAEALEHVGGDWASYLAGADLPGVDQRHDTDFVRQR